MHIVGTCYIYRNCGNVCSGNALYTLKNSSLIELYLLMGSRSMSKGTFVKEKGDGSYISYEPDERQSKLELNLISTSNNMTSPLVWM